MQLTLPTSDLNEFAATVPVKWRKNFDTWSRLLAALHANQLTKAEICTRMGVSRATVDRKIAAVKEFGWRGLIPNYKPPTRLCSEFVEYWKALQQSYQRKTAPAYRELCRRWRDRQPIPGYAGHPGWPDLPAGWDQRNLYRYQATKLELVALRHGLGRATLLHGVRTFTTRRGLWHLSHLMFDDVWLDMKSHVGMSRKPVRPMQIGVLDLLSACRFLHGTKPQLYRADGTRANLTEADMRFALAAQLCHHGISARGTTYILEHGTATMGDREMDILRRAFGDLVQFDFSGMIGKAQVIAGMSDGKGGGGNPFFKAALESLHNLIHNELAALPAQTGHDRDEPEFLGVIEREHEQLWRLAMALPEDQRLAVWNAFKFPTPEFHTQLVPAINHLLEVINQRTTHALEGWEACGFITKSYRLQPGSAEWVNESRLQLMPPAVQQAYLVMAEMDKRCFQPRRLSPREVFEMGTRGGEIIKPPQGVIAEILYRDLAQPRECRDGHFIFKDAEVANDELIYESRVMQPDGREIELRDREKYDTVVNPFDPSVMWIYANKAAKGTFLGVAKRDMRISRAAVEAVNRAHGRVSERMADLLDDSRRRNTHRTREATGRKTHNAGVIERHRQAKEAFTRRATEALDATLVTPLSDHDTTHDHDTHEIDPRTLW